MRIAILVASLMCLGMADQPPIQTGRYHTLGYDVIEYSYDSDKLYYIYDTDGRLISQCNLMGFIAWKKERLMFLIGQPSTSHEEREQYKLQYEELSRSQDAVNDFALNLLLARKYARN